MEYWTLLLLVCYSAPCYGPAWHWGFGLWGARTPLRSCPGECSWTGASTCCQKENGAESLFPHMFSMNADVHPRLRTRNSSFSFINGCSLTEINTSPMCSVKHTLTALLRSILLINTSFTNNWLKLWSLKILPNFDSNLLSINIQKA